MIGRPGRQRGGTVAEVEDPVTRTARVLEPDFVLGIEELTLEELRRRRDEAGAERDFLSYLRRLVQVRQDLLAAERTRRSTGGEPAPLVDRLTAVLSEGSRAAHPRGEALRMTLSQDDLAEAQQRADELLGATSFERPEDLTDQVLERALQTLDRQERAISADRSAVFRVHDLLQDEVKRRYREDPSIIPLEP
jgi:hypothetical protein